MRVIITGGAGLIGSALARALIADGHEVIALTRNPARHKQPVQGMRLVQWDGRNAAGWAELADGADAIVNLAGEGIGDGRWSEQRRTRILQSRLDAGKAVLDAIRQAVRKPRVLVQGSAVGYYGARGDEIVTEESAPGRDWLAQVVVAWENSTAAAAQMGQRRVVERVLTREPEVAVEADKLAALLAADRRHLLLQATDLGRHDLAVKDGVADDSQRNASHARMLQTTEHKFK